jgi:DNA-binding MarR family transcriptional regulator
MDGDVKTRSELIEEFNTAISGLIRLRDGMYAGHVESTGLSLMQLTALTAIYEQETDVSVGRIGELIGAPPSTMTSVTNRLVSLGYIERYTPPENRRAVVLRCTEEGKAVARTVVKEDKQHLEALFDGLSDEDIEVLTRSFARMEANVREMMAHQDPHLGVA